jgi:hypothetical protein
MEWANRLGAMYQFLNDTPALAQDMASRGPQTDLAYALAYAMQNTAQDIDVYPADTQTAGG